MSNPKNYRGRLPTASEPVLDSVISDSLKARGFSHIEINPPGADGTPSVVGERIYNKDVERVSVNTTKGGAKVDTYRDINTSPKAGDAGHQQRTSLGLKQEIQANLAKRGLTLGSPS